MPSHSRNDSHGRNVRFTDSSRQEAVPANEMRSRVRVDAAPREHGVYTQDPPTRGRWDEEPPSPHLGTRPLPSSPELAIAELRLTERSSPGQTPTPANSPSTRTVPLTTSAPPKVDPSPYPSPSPSPPSSPKLSAADLSQYLAGPALRWDVRRTLLSESLRANDPGLNLPAFTSKRKACVLRFVVDEINEWTVTVPSRPDGLPLRVWDVLKAIESSLYNRADETALLPGEDRYEGAVVERGRRLLGKQDTNANVFRNIDFYPEAEQSYFYGLVEETAANGSTQFVVLLGPRP